MAEQAHSQVLGDPFDHAESVGPVGADRARGTTAGPADAVQPRQDPAFVIGELALALIEGDVGDRGGTIADAADHQASRDRIGLSGADRAAGLNPGALNLDPFDLVGANQGLGARKEVKFDLDRIVGIMTFRDRRE